MLPPERLVLFIDRQNMYKMARRAFFSDDAPHYYGQINPLKLGNLVCSRQLIGSHVELHQVCIYKGEPDANREPKAFAAHMKQCLAWRRSGVEVITRTLRYPPDWPASKPLEKGIDVALAVDFVTSAIEGGYDIGVIASLDTDLRPALEYVYRHCQGSHQVQVVAWRSQTVKSRLYVPNLNIWCHYLNREDYDAVADLTDYNR